MSDPYRTLAATWLDLIDLEGELAEKISTLRLESVCDGVDWCRRVIRRELPDEAERIIEILDTAFESKDECRSLELGEDDPDRE